jgi:Uma2 family endonuclease
VTGRRKTDIAELGRIEMCLPRGMSNGVNVSDRVRGWKKNFRIPDLAVYLHSSSAKNHKSHWVGGPDLMVEILSPGEAAYAKFDFYTAVGTKEILLIDRDPWGWNCTA